MPQGSLSNAKDHFSLALSVSELLHFFPLIFRFEMDSSHTDADARGGIIKKENFRLKLWYGWEHVQQG